jgi:hypothetical protein
MIPGILALIMQLIHTTTYPELLDVSPARRELVEISEPE